MFFRGLSGFERECLSEMYDIVYSKKKRIYNSLYEGHTLLNHIDKIINVYNIVNDKLKKSLPLTNLLIRTISINDEKIKLKGRDYEVKVSFEELGFDDIIKIKNHKLTLNIFNVKNNKYISEDMWSKISGGYTILSTRDKIENGFFMYDEEKEKMHIDCYAINGVIEPIGFFSTFLHEFNHYMELYNRINNNTFKEMINRVSLTGSVRSDIKYGKNIFSTEERKMLDEVIYILWSNGEQESLIGDLFGELLGRKVKHITDIGDMYNNYRIFNKYEEIKEFIEELKNIDANILYDFFFVKNAYEFILGGKSIKNMTPNRFKNYFIKHSEDRLNKLYKKGTKFIGDYLRVIKDFEENHIEKFVSIKNK